MKKILSILCVALLMLSCMAVAVNAEGDKPTLTWVKNETLTTGSTEAYDLILNMHGSVATVKGVAIYVDGSAFVNAGYPLAPADKKVMWRGSNLTSSGTVNVVNSGSNQMLLITKQGLAEDGNSDLHIASIVLDTTKITSDLTINFLNTKGKETKISCLDENNATASKGIADFDYTPLVIKAPSKVKTITKTGTDVIVNGAKTKADGTTTDEQIGGAAGFAFTIPEGVTLDDNMIWSLTTSAGKKFSQKVNAGLSVLSGPVKVAATFVTGSHRTGEDVNTEITAVNAIFKAGEDFYFTDEADAKAQLK